MGLFQHIEIVTEKDRVTYQRLLDRYGVSSDEFLMVGNSLRSDVLSVVAIEGRAIHVPCEITWKHERIEGDIPEGAVTPTSLASLWRRSLGQTCENPPLSSYRRKSSPASMRISSQRT